MNRIKGVIFSYALMVFEVLSTLLLTPYILRSLGQAEYGVYSLTLSITAYLLLLDMGVGNAVVRFISKYRAHSDIENQNKFLGISLIYYLIIATLVGILGALMVRFAPLIFSKGLSTSESLLNQKLLIFTTANAAITLGTASFANVLIAYERFTFSRLCSIFQIIIRMVVIYAALRMGYRSEAIVIINLALTIILRSVFILYIFYELKLKPVIRGVRLSDVKEIFVYSSLIFVQMIATMLNASAAQIMLGCFITASSVYIAIYSIGLMLASYFQSIGSSITSVLMPGIVKLVESGATDCQLQKEMVRVGRIIFMVLGAILVIFCLNGSTFVSLWAGHDNTDAFPIAGVLMSMHLLIMTFSVGTQVLWAKNKHKEQTWLKMFGVVLNVTLTYFLIRWNPLVGATIGTCVSLALSDVLVMAWVFKKHIGLNLGEYCKQISKGTVPSLLVTAIIGLPMTCYLPQSWMMFVTSCASMLIVYIAMMFIVGLNDYEKGLLSTVFQKIRRVN